MIKMSAKQNQKRQLGTPANIIASVFNLPVMVIAGLIIGSLISSSFSSPIREFIMIGTTLTFFIIAIAELYYVVKRQNRKDQLSILDQNTGLRKLILENQEESE
jgi:hypothetical protein